MATLILKKTFIDSEMIIPAIRLFNESVKKEVPETDLLNRITALAARLGIAAIRLDQTKFSISRNLLSDNLMCCDGSTFDQYPLAKKCLEIYTKELLLSYERLLAVFMESVLSEDRIRGQLSNFMSVYKNDSNGIVAIIQNMKLIDFYDKAMEDVEKYLKKTADDPEIFVYLPMVCLIEIIESSLTLERKSLPYIFFPFIQDLVGLRQDYANLCFPDKKQVITALDSDLLKFADFPQFKAFIAKVKDLAFRFSREKDNINVHNFILELVFLKRK